MGPASASAGQMRGSREEGEGLRGEGAVVVGKRVRGAGGPGPWIGPASHALGAAAAAAAELGWAGQRGRRAWAALTASTHARLSARSAACAAPRRRGQTKGAEGRSEGGRLRVALKDHHYYHYYHRFYHHDHDHDHHLIIIVVVVVVIIIIDIKL